MVSQTSVNVDSIMKQNGGLDQTPDVEHVSHRIKGQGVLRINKGKRQKVALWKHVARGAKWTALQRLLWRRINMAQ